VSRVGAGKLELHKERIELAPILRQAVEVCRPLAEGAKHRLAVELPSPAIYLYADPARLAQVFSNLLNNACKYTNDGGSILLSAEHREHEVVVKVNDNGIGIPADKLTSIFELFAQAHTTPGRSQGGLGIGLTVVKRLVEMHGGSVSVASEGPGLGSEFSVCLPTIAGKLQVPQSNLPALEAGAMTTRRILVVDDNDDSAESLAMLLKMSGNETDTANDGLAALAAVETFRPNVVLLDISLPKMDGHEVARRIRREPWGKDIVLVALTGWGQDEDRRKSKEAGFDEHMIKPVDYKALMRLLSSV
jgi:CheY-like chemotaxis protein/two-component sensor histidine kinase